MKKSHDPIVIVDGARTPMGSFQGVLAGASATELGSTAIRAALDRSGIKPEDVDDVLMGCVLPAGLGQAPARQSALGAGIPDSTSCTTINTMCGSGLKAVMMVHDTLLAGSASVSVAGGIESMTNAPYILPKARGGMRMGHGEVKDHMFLDGLEDAYSEGKLMGHFAEETARKYQFTREAQDDFAITSLERACHAIDNDICSSEIAPVTIKGRKGDTVVNEDEQPKKANPDKIRSLRPVFAKDGTVTAANASSISDGAAALVLMRQSEAEARGLEARARILGHSSWAHEPEWFTTAPVYAVDRLLQRLGMKNTDSDLFEINEAFAVVTMAAMQECGLPHDLTNIYGGACAVGHPVGASGARILITLLNALERTESKRGIASLCIGGGEAVALAVERITE